MTHRELPREEWDRLAGTDLGLMIATDVINPTLRVLVVENDHGEIVAQWAAMHVWHAEGLGVSPSHRGNAAIIRHLLGGMRELLRSEGAEFVYTAAERGEAGAAVRAMLPRVGARPFNADVFFWPVVETPGVE